MQNYHFKNYVHLKIMKEIYLFVFSCVFSTVVLSSSQSSTKLFPITTFCKVAPLKKRKTAIFCKYVLKKLKALNLNNNLS